MQGVSDELETNLIGCVVSTYNEWDPLEEVIVGTIKGARFPGWHRALEPVIPWQHVNEFKARAGTTFPIDRLNSAERELEELVSILSGEGMVVRRPEPAPDGDFRTPWWSSSGLYSAMPRDSILIVGSEIIECPMAWRPRYFEVHSYRRILIEYFRMGAKWSAAPRPSLLDEQYTEAHGGAMRIGEVPTVLSEAEPTFDAADFLRFGRDIICQRSNVTNDLGIEWLARHLGDDFRVHVFEFDDRHPMHIDATLIPLAPGKMMINPERVHAVPKLFRGWDVMEAPYPVIPDSHPLYMTSKWINMNLLAIGDGRVIVEASDDPMIAAIRKFGLDPIPCPFRNFNSFGGGFHCATLDVRRTGVLESYF
jgi:glycine amidinotransferase